MFVNLNFALAKNCQLTQCLHLLKPCICWQTFCIYSRNCQFVNFYVPLRNCFLKNFCVCTKNLSNSQNVPLRIYKTRKFVYAFERLHSLEKLFAYKTFSFFLLETLHSFSKLRLLMRNLCIPSRNCLLTKLLTQCLRLPKTVSSHDVCIPLRNCQFKLFKLLRSLAKIFALKLISSIFVCITNLSPLKMFLLRNFETVYAYESLHSLTKNFCQLTKCLLCIQSQKNCFHSTFLLIQNVCFRLI